MSSFSISLDGMNRAMNELDSAAKNIATNGASPDTTVSLLEARNNGTANAQAIRVANQMQKYSIDMYA